MKDVRFIAATETKYGVRLSSQVGLSFVNRFMPAGGDTEQQTVI